MNQVIISWQDSILSKPAYCPTACTCTDLDEAGGGLTREQLAATSAMRVLVMKWFMAHVQPGIHLTRSQHGLYYGFYTLVNWIHIEAGPTALENVRPFC